MNLQIWTLEIYCKISKYKGLNLKKIIKNWDVLSQTELLDGKDATKNFISKFQTVFDLNQSSINQHIEK